MDSDPKLARRPWARVFVSYLIDTGRAGDGSWSWSFVRVLSVLAPGSVLLAAAMYSIQARVLTDHYGTSDLAPILALFPAAAVIITRFTPVLGWLVSIMGFAWTAMEGIHPDREPWPWTVIGMMSLWVIAFGIARDRPVWLSTSLWVLTLLASAQIGTVLQTETERQNFALVAVFSALATVIGIAVRSARRAQRRLAEEEQLTAAERARRTMLEERTRIARELHDVVAHHMSVITVQASTAEYRLPELPEPARDEFRSISEQARESLTEMRRLLRVLRSEDEASLRTPQPGLERLTSLVDSTVRAGTPVTLSAVRLPDDLPEAVSLTGYRIAQEGLSNVVRHASGAPTTVDVAVGGGRLRIRVANGPADADRHITEFPGAGLGLAGMRERVTLLGGQLWADATSDGGFVVDASLPIRPDSTDQEPTG